MSEYSKTQDRRSVLRKLALGLVGVALVPAVTTIREARALDNLGGGEGRSSGPGRRTRYKARTWKKKCSSRKSSKRSYLR